MKVREKGRSSLRILITAGPTREPIDAVRFLSNYSSGYLGAQLAKAALARGHRVRVIRGPCAETFPRQARVIPVEQAVEMERILQREARSSDVVIMAAAVSDFRATRPLTAKPPRRFARMLRLTPTPDLLARLPSRRRQLRVGFALESDKVVAQAKRKLRSKRLHLLLAQQVLRRVHAARSRAIPARSNGALPSPFGRQKVRAWLLSQEAPVRDLGWISKPQVACLLLDKIESLWYGKFSETP